MSFDSYTKAVLHFDGSDAGTTFTDEIGHTFTVTAEPTTVIAQKVFGTASGYWTGTGYLTSVSTDFVLNTGDWTVEFRIRFFDTTERAILVSRLSTTDYDIIKYDHTANQFELSHTNNSTVTNRNLSADLAINTWYAIAIVKDSTSMRLYVDGTLADSDTSNDMFSRSTFDIGRGYNGATAFKGWMDELRISKGIARYVANYTVASAAFGTVEPEPEFPTAAVKYKINPDIWMRKRVVSENDEFTITDEVIGGVEITSLDVHLFLGSTDKTFANVSGTNVYSGNRYTTGTISGLRGGNTYVLSARVTIDGQIKTKKCEIHVMKESVI